MAIIRVFLNPDAKQWLDMQSPNDVLQSWAIGMKEGAIACSGWVVPMTSIHHVMAIEPAAPVKPNLTTFPGGKANE